MDVLSDMPGDTGVWISAVTEWYGGGGLKGSAGAGRLNSNCRFGLGCGETLSIGDETSTV